MAEQDNAARTDAVLAETPPEPTADQAADQEFRSRLIEQIRFCGRFLRRGTDGRASQGRILAILDNHGGMAQRELMDILGIKPASASEVLAKLEDKGYIRRTRNEQDKRGVDLCLTEQGREELVRLNLQFAQSSRNLFDVLEAEELAQLSRLLGKLEAAWRLQDKDGERKERRHPKHRHGPHREDRP